MISRTVLIVAEPFPGLTGERVALALARGLSGDERGWSGGERRLSGGERGLNRDERGLTGGGSLTGGERGLTGGGGLTGGERGLTVEAVALEEQPLDARGWWRDTVPAERLRACRAVVIAAARLDERTLAGSVAFEIATSARQAGVPAYAVTGENALDPFDARMLDLQAILEAGSARSLGSAGRKLASLL